MNTEEPNEWVNAGTNNDGIDENELGPSEKKKRERVSWWYFQMDWAA